MLLTLNPGRTSRGAPPRPSGVSMSAMTTLAVFGAVIAAAWGLEGRLAGRAAWGPGVDAPRAPASAGRDSPPASIQPGGTRAVSLTMRDHESLAGALARAGLDGAEAARAADALADDFDTVNPHPGHVLALEMAGTRLVRLSAEAPGDVRLDLIRGADGGFRLIRTPVPMVAARTLVRGRVEGSLYLSLAGKGLGPDMAARIVGLFGRRLDLTRDVRDGDAFALVFEQAAPGGARTGAPDLLYAELTTRGGAARLYRFDPPGGGPADYLDGELGPRAVLLLRTPVDGARVTSAFGPRLHPILGYTRLHQGLDFAAPAGAPVLAAGDGQVVEARWSGGYGRWLRIRHSDGLETGYGHLSAWASGVAPGALVHQGQVVGFVGASGLATGPHLHYEVMRSGQRVDPAGIDPAYGPRADPDLAAAFRARKATLDARVAAALAACAPGGPGGDAAEVACAG